MDEITDAGCRSLNIKLIGDRTEPSDFVTC